MNNIVPYDFEPPAPADLQARPYQSERFSLRYIVGVILSKAWRAIGVAAVLFLIVIGFVSQIPRTYFAEGSVLIAGHQRHRYGSRSSALALTGGRGRAAPQAV